MSNILETYKSQKGAGIYDDFIEDMIEIIEASLKQPSPLHSKPIVTGRVKEEDSVEKKVLKKGDKYKSISDITDIIGIRIITYYQDDVNIIKNLLQQAFANDNSNSIDKRNYVGDSFGYGSLHLIMSFTHSPYYYKGPHIDASKYQGLKFEIQIRTILEHAWAETEHDLGYKHDLVAGLPIPIKRSFSRLAAVLETVNVEFVRLREEVEIYKTKLNESVDNNDYSSWIIADNGDNRDLQKFFWTSSLVSRVEQEIIDLTQQTRMNEPGGIKTTYLSLMVKYGITNVQQLKKLIEENEHTIKEIALTTFAVPYNYVSIKMLTGLPKYFLADYVCLYIIAVNSKDDTELQDNLNQYMPPNGISLLGALVLFRSRHKL
jgi:putative GTP pyrophosphokinase